MLMEPAIEVEAILAQLQGSYTPQMALVKQLLLRTSTTGELGGVQPNNDAVTYGDEAIHAANSAHAHTIPSLLSPSLFDFELHYAGTVKNTLETIVQEILSQQDIHVWDKSIARDPTKKLAAFAKQYFIQLLDSLSLYYGATYAVAGAYVLSFSAVDDVSTVGGKNYRLPFQSDITWNFRMKVSVYNS